MHHERPESASPRNAVAWAEIPVVDLERAVAFYRTLVDADVPVVPAGEGRIGLLPDHGGVGVALVQNPGLGYRPGSDGARLYLDAGDGLDAWSDRAVAAGGRMVVTARPTPAGDRVCVFEDVEGNLIGLRGR